MDLAQLNLWLAEHSSLILPAVAVIAFVESFAIAGIVVPGVALLFSIAAIASLSHIPVESVLIAAFLGAVAGDVLSFFIGRAFHDRLTNVWPFSRYPDALSQGERFFNKYGTISVVIGRFVGPLRPVLPLTAGMLQMPSAKFITINILSACAWAPAYILPGYLGAEFSQNAFANEHAGLSAWLVVCLILTALPWLVTLKLVSIPFKQKHVLLANLSYSIIGFLTITSLVILGAFDRLDVWLFSLVSALRNDTLDALLVATTLIGDQLLLTLLFLICVVLLLIQKQSKLAMRLALAGISASICTHLLKYGLNLSRPDLVVGKLSTASFPSGHTSGFSIFAGTLAGLILHTKEKVHYAIRSIIICVIFLVASSRVLLGVHWLSDVLAGLLLGSAIVSAALWLGSRFSSLSDAKCLHQNPSEQAVPQANWRQILVSILLVSLLYQSLLFDTAMRFYSVR
ncbi:hypothetical protein A3750_12565 [Oleiphilus sp. HI0079]|uniref:bifunctional DedA family/phosphatase PAP2 family protein n=1 Tax=Oleiphilus sp. HI0079 TaxID=1822254 RepID=UPI0007C3B711|nr:bifunctional DedA family/phosphatase PAP2 family protein [Oleiphilus sp. HI0079]KZZ14993.1 hypothetical protein A3750_12565 [Oleiphilus sp. HI0079]